MEKEQIIKALGCCYKDSQCDGCMYGKYRRKKNGTCIELMQRDALALIKQQDEQIFQLENRLNECENGYSQTLGIERAKVKALTEENANLHASCTELAQKCASLTEENAQLKHIELEALRGAANSYKELYKKRTEENEKLTRICESYALQYGTATDKEVFLKGAKADTVREMLQKALAVTNLQYRCIDYRDLEHIAKEILNENAEGKADG